jgi:hypothetical protein
MLSNHAIQVKGARTQSLFREVNDRVASLQNAWPPQTEIDFVCECYEDDCFDRLTLSHESYLSVRAHPARFLVAPGHMDDRIEIVVGRQSTHWVVEKVEAARDVAIATSPRTAEADRAEPRPDVPGGDQKT